MEDENELDPYTSLKVDCYQRTDCDDGDIRLVNGYNSHHGVVEICRQGLWGGIVISKGDGDPFPVYGWDTPNAKVVCRQLGFPWERKYIITITKACLLVSCKEKKRHGPCGVDPSKPLIYELYACAISVLVDNHFHQTLWR